MRRGKVEWVGGANGLEQWLPVYQLFRGPVFRGGSFLVTLRPAPLLGRLASPRRFVRQARPFTAELAPREVSLSRSLLSLFGLTTYCRSGTFTC